MAAERTAEGETKLYSVKIAIWLYRDVVNICSDCIDADYWPDSCMATCVEEAITMRHLIVL
jgi:hypothetical protein